MRKINDKIFFNFRSSIYYTNIVVEKLKDREEQLINLFANTLEYTAQADDEVLRVTRKTLALVPAVAAATAALTGHLL